LIGRTKEEETTHNKKERKEEKIGAGKRT